MPGEHEIFVPCNVQSKSGGHKLGVLDLIHCGMLLENGVLVACSVVEADQSTIMVRLMNVQEKDCIIKKGMVVAKMFNLL